MIFFDGGRPGSVRRGVAEPFVSSLRMGGMSREGNKREKSSRTGFTWHVRGAELAGRLRSRIGRASPVPPRAHPSSYPGTGSLGPSCVC